MSILTIHLYVGMIVAALAVLAVWRRPERRITLYVVTLQIVLGVIVMIQGLRVSWIHPALAVVAWGGYMAANAAGRREGGTRNALIFSAIASLLLLIAFGIGQAATHAAAAAG